MTGQESAFLKSLNQIDPRDRKLPIQQRERGTGEVNCVRRTSLHAIAPKVKSDLVDREATGPTQNRVSFPVPKQDTLCDEFRHLSTVLAN